MAEAPKILIIYYSKTGTTKKLVDIIKSHITADLHLIVPEKEYPEGYFTSGILNLFRSENPPKNGIPDITPYDIILIGTPIWNGGLSTPMKSFLDRLDIKGKKIGVFSTNRGGGDSGPHSDLIKRYPHSTVYPDFLTLNSKVYDGSEAPVLEWLNKIGLLPQ